MTREEEIKQAANDYLQSEGLQCNFTEDNFAAGVFEGIIVGAQWADAQPISPWISVEDYLPEDDGNYLVHVRIDGASARIIFGFAKGGKFIYLPNTFHVTHWMPIPELPEGGEQ